MDRLGGYDDYLTRAAREVAEAQDYEADWQPCALCDQPVGPQDDIEVRDDGGLVHYACYLALHDEEVA